MKASSADRPDPSAAGCPRAASNWGSRPEVDDVIMGATGSRPMPLPMRPLMPSLRKAAAVTFETIAGSTDRADFEVQTRADGPVGSLPLTDEMLRHWPSGDLFGLTQNA